MEAFESKTELKYDEKDENCFFIFTALYSSQ